MSNDNKNDARFIQLEIYVDYDCGKRYITLIEVVNGVPRMSYVQYVPMFHLFCGDTNLYIEVILN